jgi:AsmA family protein
MARRRVVRWLLGSGLAVVGLLGVAALSSPLWLRPITERLVAAMIARPVSIGRLRLHPEEPLSITAEDVVVGNPPGLPTGEEPFARTPRATVRLDALPSLRQRKVVITSIELQQPVLRFVATENGRDNYSDLINAAGAGGVEALIRSLRILDGKARVLLARLHTELEVAFATEEGQGSAAWIVAEAHGTYAGQPIAARFTGGPPLDLSDASQPWPVDLHLENGPTRVSGKGIVQDPLHLRGAKLSLKLAGPDMALLRPLMDVGFPATPPYELSGKLDYAAGVYRITEAAGRIGRSDLEGTMTIAAPPGQRPQIAAELHSHGVDLRDVGNLVAGGPGPPGTPGQTPEQNVQARRIEAKESASPRVLPQDRLDLSNLKRLDLHLAYSADRIQGRFMPLDNVSLKLDVVDGAVALRPLRFGVGQGRIWSDVLLTPQVKDTVRGRAELRFEQLDVSRLMRATRSYQGAGALSGIARVEGTGRSLAEILGSGDGAMALWMAGGELSTLLVDLAGLRLGSALLSSLGGTSRTRVECFVADLALRHGMLSTRALLLETEDALTQGEGMADLGRERLELRLRTESKRLTVGVLPGPLLISGTLKEPQAAPDPSSPAAQGGLAGAMAAIPSIHLGIGDDPHCHSLLGRISRH